MLLALGAIALLALGFLITYLLLHRTHHPGGPATAAVATTQAQTTTNALAGAVPVPDVAGMDAAQATTVLESIGLKVQTAPVAAQAGRRPGGVISESPKAGAKLAKGSQVLLTVAGGAANPTTTAASTTTAQTTTSGAPPPPANVSVPDLSGTDEAAAATALARAGLLTSLAFVPSNDPLGTVEAQGKPSGTSASYHAHVQVNVAIGPGQKPMETVPDAVGKTLQQALAAINAARLRLIYLRYPVTSKAQAGKIVQQTPLAGGSAPRNAQVIVYLAAYEAG
jgi:beta-lactam-binding protein with PASTA domain